ncbi:hypothetical protein [Streptomyces roseoverticillatus]|uniref:hypothetical protein n=1 Tax=Streptomyces roseoverticillatus TaxID=66429 RepID=UPI0004C1B79E|nr:hypothetical protein [Streptomyces roseoverticillatus]
MTGPERRNVSLEHWARVSGATYEPVAAEVIKVARAHGYHNVRPDRSRVRRWITKGEHPRGPVPEFLAEALKRLCHLTRPLTLADIGLRGTPAIGPAASWKADAVVAVIIDTARSDTLTDDSAPPTVPLLTGSQLIGAVQPWLHLPDEPLPNPIRPGSIGMTDVKAIEAATDAFRTLDSTHGGGLSRRAVLGQLPEATRAIGIADDALADDRSEPVPSWAAWFDDAEYQVTAGVCESIAATHDPRHATRAIELIEAGTTQRPAERMRSRAFDHIALARAQVQAGQLEAADHTTATALDLLGRVNSTRVTDRLRELDTEFAATRGRTATETRERIRAVISP